MIGAVPTSGEKFERRARVMPWGIEVQLWQLVETITIPGTAGTLPINTLFPAPDAAATAHVPSSCRDDETTLEHVVDASPAEDAAGSVCDRRERAAGEAAHGQEGRARRGR